MHTVEFEVPPQELVPVLGVNDAHIRLIENSFPQLDIRVNVNTVVIRGSEVETKIAEKIFLFARDSVTEGKLVDVQHVRDMLNAEMLKTVSSKNVFTSDGVIVRGKNNSIRAKTLGQQQYVDAIADHDIVFGTGPAGSGKTLLAVAMAIRELQLGRVTRIVLTRPVVEAGEKLGFLPGSLQEKIDPYVRPLFDALNYILGVETVTKLLSSGTIEISPLAYMRGRTLTESFVILDEAQNATPEQLKMFLTRLGSGSRIVVTGDDTQRDLLKRLSALETAEKILQKISGIAFCQLSVADVVRHPLISEIVRAYQNFEEKTSTKGETTEHSAQLSTGSERV